MSDLRPGTKPESPWLLQDVPVEKGMVLLLREDAIENVLPERFRLWTVASVRKGAKSASVRLLGWSPGAMMEGTATFPDGLVSEPWRLFSLSQADLGHFYKATADV